MKNGSLLLIVVAFLVGPIAFVSRAAGQQDNFWRDFGDWESRNRVLNGGRECWDSSYSAVNKRLRVDYNTRSSASGNTVRFG